VRHGKEAETLMSELQQTDEWIKARLGKATASRVGDIMARTKSGPAASRKNYRAELMVERLTGLPCRIRGTDACMQHSARSICPFAG
jgi:hypothetical protein